MSGAWGKGFWHDQSGATAALYALALPALVAVAGVGFDYAHLAALDTELQNAADQAALAGATQLDRQSGAIDRATSAAEGGLVANETLFANDGQGSDIDDLEIRFYTDKVDAEDCNDDFLDPEDEDSDASAAYICVIVEARTANYALTPVAGVLSGDLAAQAAAGVGSALCRTPPLMICNPEEAVGGSDPNADFNASAHIGQGFLVTQGGGGSWAPGNYGYLDTGTGTGATGVRMALGWTSPPGNCLSQNGVDTVDTEPGNMANVPQALNTRFDIYDAQGCEAGGTCPPSINSRKDVVRPANASGNNACKTHNQGWQQVASASRYLPGSNAALATGTTPLSMGHPRDICHATATNTCGGNGIFGDAFWDRDAYFRSHYLRTAAGSSGEAIGTRWSETKWRSNLAANGFTGTIDGVGVTRPTRPTRYEVYLWEIANRGTTIDGVVILGASPPGASGATLVNHGQPICSSQQTPSYGSGQIPGTTVADRRRVSVAVVNCGCNSLDDDGDCRSVAGNTTGVKVRRWMDVFLVQPSLARDRTTQDQIYVEVIGENQAGSSGETAGTVIRRDLPYLLR